MGRRDGLSGVNATAITEWSKHCVLKTCMHRTMSSTYPQLGGGGVRGWLGYRVFNWDEGVTGFLQGAEI